MANWLSHMFRSDAPGSSAPVPGRVGPAGASAAKPVFTAPATRDDPRRSLSRERLALSTENLLGAIRRLPASDMVAAAIDFTRDAHAAGTDPKVLLNAVHAGGASIGENLARSKIDLRAKLAALMSMGWKLDRTKAAGDNLLHEAARHGNALLVAALFESAPLRCRPLLAARTATFGSYVDASPLALSVLGNHHGLVELLIRLGASPTEPCATTRDGASVTAQNLCLTLDKPSDMLAAVRLRRSAGRGLASITAAPSDSSSAAPSAPRAHTAPS